MPSCDLAILEANCHFVHVVDVRGRQWSVLRTLGGNALAAYVLHGLVEDFVKVAKKHHIPFQKSILPRGGQDGAAIQRAGIGARCIAIVTGTRDIHTSTEMVDKGDLNATVELLAEWLGGLD